MAANAYALDIDLFYSEGCRECDDVKNGIIADLKEDYAGRVAVNEYNTSDLGNYLRLIELEERYGVESDAPVAVFAGDVCLPGREAIERDLYAAVESLLSTKIPETGGPGIQDAEEYGYTVSCSERDKKRITKRFRSFSAAAVLAAGLADGINPCAFATIVFLISFLTVAGRTRRDILFISVSFGLAVFITYTLLGLGAFKILTATALYGILSRAIYYAAGIIVFILGLLSLKDAVMYLKDRDAGSISLKLPPAIRDKIHFIIRNRLKTRGLALSAFTVGSLVSLLESVCTGQVYLPTIVFITKEPGLSARAYYYLILYNLMFIVPLAAAAAITYFGIDDAALRRFGMRNVFISKLLLAAVFFVIAAVLLRG